MRQGRWWSAALLATWTALSGAGCAARTASTATSTTAGPAVAAPAASSISDHVAAVFDAAADAAIWSALFVWADSGETIYARNPDQRLLPASNMKLVTLAAAIQRLGWTYRFETIVFAPTAPVDGRLEGSLYVKGSGDPTLGWPTASAMPTLRQWARTLRAQGVVRIEGDLVGDADALGADRLGDSWSWDDLPYGYAAPYAGLTFHENTVAVVLTPGRALGEPARIDVEPAGSGLHVSHDVMTVAQDGGVQVRVDRPLGTNALRITGHVPLGSAPIVRYAAVPDPPLFFLQAFRLALAAEGIEVRGHTRVGRGPDASGQAGAHPVRVVHHSAPLADIAVRFMKVSQNLYGEALLHALAPDPTATLASRRVVVNESLAALGIVPVDLQVSDGSGLSRRNFVTPRTLVALLQAMSSPAHREAFRRTLPIAGVDGTLERRLAGTACAGRVQAKTGTLSHARGLSGYLETATGRTVVFSVLANNYLQPTSDIDAHVDRALLLLCQ